MGWTQLGGVFQQIDGLFDVGINLGIHLSNGCTRLACRAAEGGACEQGYTGITLMALIGAGKPLREHKIAIGTQGICLAHIIVHQVGRTRNIVFQCDNAVGLGNARVVGIPQVKTAPCCTGVATLDIIGRIKPEPARALGTHNHVIAHDLSSQRMGKKSKGLMGIARC